MPSVRRSAPPGPPARGSPSRWAQNRLSPLPLPLEPRCPVQGQYPVQNLGTPEGLYGSERGSVPSTQKPVSWSAALSGTLPPPSVRRRHHDRIRALPAPLGKENEGLPGVPGPSSDVGRGYPDIPSSSHPSTLCGDSVARSPTGPDSAPWRQSPVGAILGLWLCFAL